MNGPSVHSEAKLGKQDSAVLFSQFSLTVHRRSIHLKLLWLVYLVLRDGNILWLMKIFDGFYKRQPLQHFGMVDVYRSHKRDTSIPLVKTI